MKKLSSSSSTPQSQQKQQQLSNALIQISGVITEILSSNKQQQKIVISKLEVNPKYPNVLFYDSIILETSILPPIVYFKLNTPITVRGLYSFKPYLQTLPSIDCNSKESFIRYDGHVYRCE